jgi:hypothetical protein
MALLTVIESFADFSAGRPEVYNPGRLVDEKDPVVKGRERHFEPAEAAASRVRVEAASAAPGERRERTRPARKAAKKAAAKKAPAKKAAATPKAKAEPVSPQPPTGDNAPATPSSEQV